MSEPNPENLRRAIFEIIHNQIHDHEPPETKATLDRLLADGFPEAEAMTLIGCVVSAEIFEVLKYGRSFNRERYVQALARLPELPED